MNQTEWGEQDGEPTRMQTRDSAREKDWAAGPAGAKEARSTPNEWACGGCRALPLMTGVVGRWRVAFEFGVSENVVHWTDYDEPPNGHGALNSNAISFSSAASNCLDLAFNRNILSRLKSTTFAAPFVSLLSVSSILKNADRSAQCSSCQIAALRIKSSIFLSHASGSSKSTCSLRMMRDER